MRRIIVAFGCLLALGCTKRVINEGTYPPVHVESENTGIRWDNASILEAGIRNKIAVESVSGSRSQTGTLAVSTVLRNRTSYSQAVEVRTSFYGGDKTPVEPPSEWRRIFLTANGVERYQALSMKPEAAHFYVEIRESR